MVLTDELTATSVGSDSLTPSDSDQGDSLPAATTAVFTVTVSAGISAFVLLAR